MGGRQAECTEKSADTHHAGTLSLPKELAVVKKGGARIETGRTLRDKLDLKSPALSIRPRVHATSSALGGDHIWPVVVGRPLVRFSRVHLEER